MVDIKTLSDLIRLSEKNYDQFLLKCIILSVDYHIILFLRLYTVKLTHHSMTETYIMRQIKDQYFTDLKVKDVTFLIRNVSSCENLLKWYDSNDFQLFFDLLKRDYDYSCFDPKFMNRRKLNACLNLDKKRITYSCEDIYTLKY